MKSTKKPITITTPANPRNIPTQTVPAPEAAPPPPINGPTKTPSIIIENTFISPNYLTKSNLLPFTSLSFKYHLSLASKPDMFLVNLMTSFVPSPQSIVKVSSRLSDP